MMTCTCSTQALVKHQLPFQAKHLMIFSLEGRHDRLVAHLVLS
jgi:hypothetical protein